MSRLTLQHAFELAVRHHQAGRTREAKALYEQMLAQQPDHADACHMRGLLAYQDGDFSAAAEWIGRAIRVRADVAAYHCNLGLVWGAAGQLEAAIVSFRRAISLQPAFPEAYNNLGNVLRQAQRTDEAVRALRHAIRQRPQFAEAHYNLANALRSERQTSEAIACYQRAIALRPGYAEALSNLGGLFMETGRIGEAVAVLGQAASLQPASAEAQLNLGRALAQKGSIPEAAAAFSRAIALRPDWAEAHNHLGAALRKLGRLDEAITAYGRALAAQPNFPQALNNLGNAFRDSGRLDEALASLRAAIATAPDFADAHYNLGNVLKDLGMLDEALAAYQQAMTLQPENDVAHSAYLYTLLFHPVRDPASLLRKHQEWDRRHAAPLVKLPAVPLIPRAGRRLRIGYVCPYFTGHVVGFNLLPLLREHDHGSFEIFCYSDVARPDALTPQFYALADHWREIHNMSDADVAALVRQDRIDILVDTSLHMSPNRLLVFARKPAPVQATFAGYPGTTVLAAIDYRLTDPYLDPDPANDCVYSERSIRLADSFWCYAPLEEVSLGPQRAADAPITFGCMSNFCKVNDRTLDLWIRIMQQTPESRLLLLAPPGDARVRIITKFRDSGIDAARLDFVGRQSRRAYLETHYRIDVVLDTYPYNGHTTILDALWMAVPVITQAGPSVVSRAGQSILSNLGIMHLIAKSDDEYVSKAVALASDREQLANLRRALRQRMKDSPLMDAPRFARSVERAYHEMWDRSIAQCDPRQ